jgi:hypothetical protein
MELNRFTADGHGIAEVVADGVVIWNPQDALDLIAEAGAQGAYAVILHAQHLTPAFFKCEDPAGRGHPAEARQLRNEGRHCRGVREIPTQKPAGIYRGKQSGRLGFFSFPIERRRSPGWRAEGSPNR